MWILVVSLENKYEQTFFKTVDDCNQRPIDKTTATDLGKPRTLLAYGNVVINFNRNSCKYIALCYYLEVICN